MNGKKKRGRMKSEVSEIIVWAAVVFTVVYFAYNLFLELA